MTRHQDLPPFVFGQDLQWRGSTIRVFLYVELPFWLMLEPATMAVEWEGYQFTVDLCSPQVEVFVGEFLDSRRTIAWRGPEQSLAHWKPTQELQNIADARGLPFMSRRCKTVLRIQSLGLESAFSMPGDHALPREERERDAYWASLCEAHIPVVNELIQRYRLQTCDYFAYEVSAWDVPIWYVRAGGDGRTVVLMPYKEWDERPLEIGRPPEDGGERPARQFQFTDGAALDSIDSSVATPGEFDLLDARSLMERGDYTGAVRRATTAIEAVVGWRLRKELLNRCSEAEVETRLTASENDFPGRLRQLQKMLGTSEAWKGLTQQFDVTRQIRHDIVHRGRRLAHDERGIAQRSVDTGRWLFNHIEDLPARARLRDYGVLKSVGRVALATRFPTRVTSSGIEVLPLHASSAEPSPTTGAGDEPKY